MKKSVLFLLIFAVISVSCVKQIQTDKRFLRGVWIATVGNIDWPRERGLSAEEQQRQLTAILDEVKRYNMNAVILQVRPTADAFYRSEYEPYSYWLSGVQGEEPGYDPLQFAVEECHKRGLLLHVWLNPYRINNNTKSWNSYAANHIINTHSEWTVDYGDGKYFNPGLQSVRDYTCKVVKDIVERYDIDAIHFDDYFYPYKIAGVEFPDDSTFARYPRGFTDKADWRRDNVNLIIKELSATIKGVKPYVEFGISPFAIWRNREDDPRGSDTNGTSNYDGLYADILLWQKEGWIDYVMPQLYFSIGYPIADYAKLADWWSANTYGTMLYVGLAPYKVNKQSKDKEWRSSQQIFKQIDRNMRDPNIKGEVFFSAKQIFDNKLFKEEKRFRSEEYRYKTISPENVRIPRIISAAPSGLSVEKVDGNKMRFKWERGQNAKRFVLYRFGKKEVEDIDKPQHIIEVTGLTEVVIKCSEGEFKKYRYGVTSLSPTHSESSIVYFN
jgi:uncharacterized lipoprotein YddW (UPF0748 family)